MGEDIFVIDLETTGFKGFPHDLVLEVGIAKVTDFQDVETIYHSLISYGESNREKIEKCWWFNNTEVTIKDLEDAPGLGQVWNDVIDIISGNKLTSWNVGFDLTRFVDRIPPTFNYLREKDPMQVAAKHMKTYYGGYKTPSLSDAARFLEIEYNLEAVHRADYDALVTGKVIIELYNKGWYKI